MCLCTNIIIKFYKNNNNMSTITPDNTLKYQLNRFVNVLSQNYILSF